MNYAEAKAGETLLVWEGGTRQSQPLGIIRNGA